jgi:hypothetical protein
MSHGPQTYHSQGELAPVPRDRPRVYGVMAEFSKPEQVVAAAKAAYDAGYRQMDAYSPMPVHGLAEALGFRRNRLPLVVLVGGLLGGFGGLFMQWFSAVVHYPIIVGGRPFASWPSFIPITFEMTVLCAALGAVFGMLALNGLPRPHHPVFNAENFALASRSRFFLCIQSNDRRFDVDATSKFLHTLSPNRVSVVPM